MHLHSHSPERAHAKLPLTRTHKPNKPNNNNRAIHNNQKKKKKTTHPSGPIFTSRRSRRRCCRNFPPTRIIRTHVPTHTHIRSHMHNNMPKHLQVLLLSVAVCYSLGPPAFRSRPYTRYLGEMSNLHRNIHTKL